MARKLRSRKGKPTSARETLSLLARGSRSWFVTVGTASELLGVPRSSAARRLALLVRRGWMARARRGSYLILPLEAGPRGPVAVEDAWVLARELYAPCYIGGWSAAEHWGLTEQLFRSTLVVSAASVRRKKERVLGAEFEVVRVPPARLRGAALVWRGRERVPASDRERTLVDGLVNPAWLGGVRHLVKALRAYRESREWSPEKLREALLQVGRGPAFKRIGYILETLLPEERDLIDLARAHRTAGLIKLDPAVSARGRANKRWGLWVNVALPETGATP